ncbi:hypothetical protein [Lentzea sp. NEAU-D7]|uniref:hypothetical protein n=1 Tax=Lentzea sp. NEAU-D7 TaxID=2994667 RepID=UPI00224B21A2|nr:hypothetical protein [Lentzea sp. NEAU-D7]MCX2947319.1 hypothetical protein [Lentzea sp. NEAU-D7]
MRLSRLVIPLLCMWLFGNLYEQVVWNPQLLADPRPGSLVGVFAAGSPIYYYLPWAPLAVVLAVVTRVPKPAGLPRGLGRDEGPADHAGQPGVPRPCRLP